MEQGSVRKADGFGSSPDRQKPPHVVTVEIDNKTKHIQPGDYVVATLKERLGVPADKDLDQVIAGTLTTLDDQAHVVIQGGEIFFSHVRRGGSS